MEQLLSMGFSDDMAAQALSATGGDSPSKAVDWILSQTPSNDTDTSPQSHKTTSKPTPDPCHGHSSPHPFQPKLDRFFKATDSGSPSSSQNDVASTPPSKRPKPGPPEPQAGPAAGVPGERVGPAAPPLAERMRPRSLDEVVGQDHLLGSATSLLRAAAERGRLPSLILWGPPGTGKTSLARALLGSSPDPSSFRFVALSAVTAGVKDVRDAAANAKAKARATTVLFVDEVHRFSKAQQDSLLPIIEDGSVVFLGATTENPSFHLTTPLLSRCRVLLLRPLGPHHLAALLRRAARDTVRGLSLSVGAPAVDVPEDAVQFISSNCDGDARAALNALEIAATAAAARAAAAANADAAAAVAVVVAVSLEDAKEAMQCKHLAYDRDGEEHYNLISALHKSMRGGDGNAGIYWLARMLEGGEEPLYIARRLIRFASEDIGLADPLALNQAVACYQACHFLGMPECNVILAQCVAYLALAPKSVAVYRAIGAAQKAVRDSVGQNEGVPLHLRNAPTKLMKEIGYGKGYIYTPDDPSSFQSFLPPSLEGCKFLNWPESR